MYRQHDWICRKSLGIYQKGGEYSKLTEHKVIKSFEISFTVTTENIDYLRINLEK